MNKIGCFISSLFHMLVCICIAFTTWKVVQYLYPKLEKKPVDIKE